MSKVYVALGSPEKFVKLGDFNVTTNGKEMDVYYNIDVGDHRLSMFDINSGIYKNLKKTHQSFHYSGQGHFKEKSKGEKCFLGNISDGSVLNCPEKDPLILGVESFFFDIAASKGSYEPTTLFLNPPCHTKQYSILWFFVPTGYPQKVHPRYFYENLWGRTEDYYTCQTAALIDMTMTSEMQTISIVNEWEIRALFLKPLLPVMTQGLVFSHPKGIEMPWRAWVSLDAHLPLHQMLRHETLRKKPILTTQPYQIPEAAKTPMAWVKQKEPADGTNSTK